MTVAPRDASSADQRARAIGPSCGIVAPPSTHASGHVYEWEHRVGKKIPAAPANLLELIKRTGSKPAKAPGASQGAPGGPEAPKWVAEALQGRRLHTQNFRRLVESAAVVEPTGETSHATGGRPAALFRFRREVLQERPAPGLRVGARG